MVLSSAPVRQAIIGAALKAEVGSTRTGARALSDVFVTGQIESKRRALG
jgi:hypothetical protein